MGGGPAGCSFLVPLRLPPDLPRISGDFTECPAAPPRRLSPLTPPFHRFQAPCRELPALPHAGVSTFRVRGGHTATHSTAARGAGRTGSVFSLKQTPHLPWRGRDGAVGAGRFFSGMGLVLNHPPPILPPERGVATSPLRSESLSQRGWEGLAGVEGWGGSGPAQGPTGWPVLNRRWVGVGGADFPEPGV